MRREWTYFKIHEVAEFYRALYGIRREHELSLSSVGGPVPGFTDTSLIKMSEAVMRPCWGKIPTKDVALKQRHKTSWNGYKRHKDWLNTDKHGLPLKTPNDGIWHTSPLPNPQEGIFNSGCWLNCMSAVCLDNAGAKICLNWAKW